MGDEIVVQQLEIGLREPAVAVPPDSVLGERVDHRVLVLGAATGMDTGLGAQRAARDERRFAAGDGVLVERGLGEIPMNRGEILEAEFVGAIGTVSQTRFLHGKTSTTTPAAARLTFPTARTGHTASPRRDRPLGWATYSGEREPCQGGIRAYSLRRRGGL